MFMIHIIHANDQGQWSLGSKIEWKETDEQTDGDRRTEPIALPTDRATKMSYFTRICSLNLSRY